MRPEALLPRAYWLTRARITAVQHDGLTAREREIEVLVGQRHTNRDIATDIMLAGRTVATHVIDILNKLDVDSRAEMAIWAVSGIGKERTTAGCAGTTAARRLLLGVHLYPEGDVSIRGGRVYTRCAALRSTPHPLPGPLRQWLSL